MCRVCKTRPGFAFDIVIPGQGRSRVALCELHDTELAKIIALGQWHPFGKRKGRSQVEKEDLGELLSHRK